MKPRFSAEQVEQYHEDGFVVLPRLFPEETLAPWTQRLSDIVEGHVEPSEGMLVMKDVMVAKGAVHPGTALEAIAKLQDYERDPVLDSYPLHPDLLPCVEQLIGENVMTIHTMLINKPPNVDGRHPLHQDLLYFPFRPADRIVATWTALEPVTKKNGCLVVLPGTHKGELLEHENPEWEHLNLGYFGAKGMGSAKAERVHLEMSPGDTVFFHPILLHGSGRNQTQGFRRAISAHFANADCTWEWSGPKDLRRHYRIVTGPNQGQAWNGKRGEAVNPLDYLPFGNPN
ncbi:MAG: phytanoyl-CoA dioxygenase family protein [Deltaproteobacteria bacterium]|nr:phytanoyl-CoA dioxygenase family protein [Deltaproteobacteria bacterium]